MSSERIDSSRAEVRAGEADQKQYLDPCRHQYLIVNREGVVLARQSNLLAAMQLAAMRLAHVEGMNGFLRTEGECFAEMWREDAGW